MRKLQELMLNILLVELDEKIPILNFQDVLDWVSIVPKSRQKCTLVNR
jgi:hypothetical protein